MLAMFELILNTIRETILKAKVEIINEILNHTSRDSAEIRCDLLEIKGLLKNLYFKENLRPVKLIEPSNCIVSNQGLPKEDFFKRIRKYPKL